MKVAVLVNTYAPWHSANSNCIDILIRHLHKNHSFTIISSTSCSTECDYAEVICPEPLKASIKFLERFFSLIRRVFNANGFDILRSNYFLDEMLRHKQIFDAIVPVCFPVESLNAANNYKTLYPQTKIIPYLLDLFSTSSTAHTFFALQKIKLARNINFELSFLNRCSFILANEAWVKHIAGSITSNTLSITSISYPLIIDRQNSPFDFENKTIVYSGTLDKKSRNPSYALNILSQVIKKIGTYNIHFIHKGNCGGIVDKFSRINSRIINLGSMEGYLASNQISQASFLLFIGNNDTRQVPSKIYEYISTGKPILVFLSIESDPVVNLFTNYPLSCIIFKNMEQDVAINKLESFILNSSGSNVDFSYIHRTFSESTPAFCAAQLDAALKF